MSDGALYIELDTLALLFGYKNKETARKAIYSGAFPVATYKLRGSWVADKEAVKEFFRRKRAEAMAQLNSA